MAVHLGVVLRGGAGECLQEGTLCLNLEMHFIVSGHKSLK